jgi:hypothetical protein
MDIMRVICADHKDVDVVLSVLLPTHRPTNNTTTLAMWKNLQPKITKLIITLHQYPYDLHT